MLGTIEHPRGRAGSSLRLVLAKKGQRHAPPTYRVIETITFVRSPDLGSASGFTHLVFPT
ncbi:MAG: hypothetical protein JXQ75_03320 [Phycisphaerae bacterium]|nr:hypothetical protein [Phycisphaerae bacterium]